MDLREFHNALRILLNIDYDEFASAVTTAQASLPDCLGRDDPAEQWPRFRDAPHMWFIRAPEAQAQAIWAIVERRNARLKQVMKEHAQ